MPGTHSPARATWAGSDRFGPQTFALPARAPAGAALRMGWGGCSRPAAGKANEDFYALMFPDQADAGRREVMIALADGVSADGNARSTIEAAVLGLVSDYYATPGEWSVARALDRLLCAANDWIWAQNIRVTERDGVVGAVSLLVLEDGRYSLAHVGDTRVYRLRQGKLKQLTVDHVWPRRDLRHVLRRALGLDSHLVVDFGHGELEAGDVFLMVTDGVWEVLGDIRMTEIIGRGQHPEPIARALVAAAHERQAPYMGRNDATAVVLRIERPAA